MDARKAITKILLIIAGVTPLIIVPIIYLDYFYFPKIFFVYVMASFMAIIWLTAEKDSNYRLDFTEKAIFAYLLVLVISTLFSIDIGRSLWGIERREEGLFAIIIYIALFMFAKHYYQYSGSHLKYFLLSGSVVALYGIMQYFGFDPIPRDLIRLTWGSTMPFSTMGNPNFFGTYLVLLLPLGVFSFIYSKKKIFLLFSCIQYFALLCTYTRSAWLGSLVSLAILMYYVVKYKVNTKYLGIVLILFMGITVLFNFHSKNGIIYELALSVSDIKAVTLQSANYEEAGTGRLFIWERVVKLIGKRPILGAGLETLDLLFEEEYENDILQRYKHLYIFDKAHNEYLHIAYSTGVPSLLIYLVFISHIVYRGIKAIKYNLYIVPVLCSIIGYLVQAFFNISVVSVAYIYWILLGIMLNFSEENSSLLNSHKV